MLPQRAVDLYLNRQRLDYRVYKRLSDAKLDALARKYQVPADCWSKQFRHQRVMTLAGLRAKRFAFWCDTGTGKTFVSLTLAQLLTRDGVTKRWLVLVPRRTNKSEWQNEIRKHFPNLRYSLFPSNNAGKWAALAEDAVIFVETYSGLYSLLCEKRRNKKGKNKLQPSARLLKQLTDRIDGLILDESTEAKRRGALPFRLCNSIAKQCKAVYALSATPHGRDPTDLWGQMFLLDQGETLGETLGLFRSTFFTERNGFWGGMEYKFKKPMAGRLHDIMANRSLRFEVDELDLPKRVDIVKSVDMPADAGLYYQRAKQQLLQAGNLREMKAMFTRMRQISSGFVGFIDDSDDSRVELEFPDNPKLDLLLSIIERVLPSKLIVFHEFIWSTNRIARELDALAIGYQQLYGATRDPTAALKRWNESERYPVLLLQNSFGIGLNLQAAKYGIFFEAPCSPITRKQCIRRFERQHSPHSHVYQYDLVMKDTADEAILRFLREGNDLLSSIVDGRAALCGTVPAAASRAAPQ